MQHYFEQMEEFKGSLRLDSHNKSPSTLALIDTYFKYLKESHVPEHTIKYENKEKNILRETTYRASLKKEDLDKQITKINTSSDGDVESFIFKRVALQKALLNHSLQHFVEWDKSDIKEHIHKQLNCIDKHFDATALKKVQEENHELIAEISPQITHLAARHRGERLIGRFSAATNQQYTEFVPEDYRIGTFVDKINFFAKMSCDEVKEYNYKHETVLGGVASDLKSLMNIFRKEKDEPLEKKVQSRA